MDAKRFEAIKTTAVARRAGGVVKMSIGELIELAKQSANTVLLQAAEGLDDPDYAGGEVYPPAPEVAAACEAIEAANQPAKATPPATINSLSVPGAAGEASEPLFQE